MSLNQRIFLYFFSIFFLMLIMICYFQYQREKEYRTEHLNQQLTTYNQTINKYIAESKPSWEALLDYVQLFPDSNLRVTLVDSTGFVAFDSSVKKGKRLSNHLDREEIQMAKYTGVGTAIRHSYTTGEEYYYLANKFGQNYVRSALPYNVKIANMLKANLLFLNFIGLALLIAAISFYYITKKFTRSIDRLRIFTKKAENEEIRDTDIDLDFPNDELGEISKNIVKLYKLQVQTKYEVNLEREKLIKHFQMSQEGLGIFSAEKKEILANNNFIQYTNILSDQQSENSDQIFLLPEFTEINTFIDESFNNNELTRKRITIEKGGRIFAIQSIVFQDNTFEISINDISIQEHEYELKRNLTQNISHELKTPVSSILGYMESILENPEMDIERQRFFVERSFLQAQRLRDLLQDISTLNKIDETKLVFEKEACNLSEIITDVLKDVNLEIEQKQFEVKFHFGNEKIITGNRSLLYSIFRNLMDNSLAYGGEKLTIDINCYREDKEFCYFSFSDNGVGVAEEHLSKLFERFYRVDKGRSRKVGGTGLGLAIVKNAVLFHNGTISAKQSPSGGLSFIFSLKKA